MEKKKNVPKKGAAQKWSEKLKDLGKQPPPKDLMEILNEKDKKVAMPVKSKDVEI